MSAAVLAVAPYAGPMRLRELADMTTELANGREIAALDLIDSWGVHVARLVLDAERPEPPTGFWGMWDYIATLHIRSRVAQMLGNHEPPPAVAAIDELFRRFSEPDTTNAVSRFEADALLDGWWWNLIPREGSAREELDSVLSG